MDAILTSTTILRLVMLLCMMQMSYDDWHTRSIDIFPFGLSLLTTFLHIPAMRIDGFIAVILVGSLLLMRKYLCRADAALLIACSLWCNSLVGCFLLLTSVCLFATHIYLCDKTAPAVPAITVAWLLTQQLLYFA